MRAGVGRRSWRAAARAVRDHVDHGGRNPPPGRERSRPGASSEVATEPATNRDPAFASARSDILINQQVYDWLVEVGQNNQLLPGLATAWDSPDGKVVDLHAPLRREVLQRLAVHGRRRRLHLRSAARPRGRLARSSSLYANVTAHQGGRRDPRAVRRSRTPTRSSRATWPTITRPSSPRRSPIRPREWVGTGPFTIASYSAEDRAVLKKNPNYWMKDAQGKQLPYLDEIQFIFSPDVAGQVEALRGDQVQFVAGLTSELVDSIKTDSKLKVITGPLERLPLRDPHAFRRRPPGGRSAGAQGAAAGHRPPGTHRPGAAGARRGGQRHAGGARLRRLLPGPGPRLRSRSGQEAAGRRRATPAVSPSPSTPSRRWRCRPSPPSGRSR